MRAPTFFLYRNANNRLKILHKMSAVKVLSRLLSSVKLNSVEIRRKISLIFRFLHWFRMFLWLLLAGALPSSLSLIIKNPVTVTKYGSVLGTWGVSRSNKTYSAFIGIPYAKPPIGDLRFAVSFNNFYSGLST